MVRLMSCMVLTIPSCMLFLEMYTGAGLAIRHLGRRFSGDIFGLFPKPRHDRFFPFSAVHPRDPTSPNCRTSTTGLTTPIKK
ncbi:hypothetical protein WG66_001077 [Moniliophthora roreri]|nr:hypothetical protein WG66_001077 [Moniliophthora roreri]